MYKTAATTASINRPRINPFLTVLRYNNAAASTNCSGMFKYEATLRNSVRAMLRLRCMELEIDARLCHLMRRYIWALLLLESLFPRESAPRRSMTVTSPLLSLTYFIGLPVRATSSNPSESKERHSFPKSISSSETMSPHCWQTISPFSVSLRSLVLPHSGQTLPAMDVPPSPGMMHGGVTRNGNGINKNCCATQPRIDISISCRSYI